MTPCPTPARLERWVNEQLDPADQTALSAHIDRCPACQAALDRLTADTPKAAPPPDPEFDGLLRQLKETLPGKPSISADGDRPVLPGYDLIEVVGRGGMGVVFRARQTGVNREVAVKLLHRGPADGDDAARFRREGEALGKLRHPNVVQVFDVGVADGRPFLVMEYVPGGPLSRQTDGKPLPPAAAAEIAEGVARAVQHAHDHGILHRDLKPGNILVQRSEDRGQTSVKTTDLCPLTSDLWPKVADFGLARSIDAGETLTQTGMAVGTPSYMAPEQIAGSERLTPAADVYGLGAVLYELLTGRPPFSGANAADILIQVRDQDPVPPSRVIPTLPRDLNTITLKCLAKDPRKRYPSAAAAAEDLRRYRAGEPILARPVGTAEKAWKWARRRKAAAAAVGLGLFLLVVGLPTVTLLWLWAEAERRAANKARGEQAVALDQADRNLYSAHIALAELNYRQNYVPRTRLHLEACRPDRRGWEWYYLNELANSEHVNLPAPPPPDAKFRALYAVGFSPDGRWLAGGGGVRHYLSYLGTEPGQLALWEPATGRTVSDPAGPEPLAVTAVAWGADGRLFTVSADVWHRETTRTNVPDRVGPPGRLRARDGRTGALLFDRPIRPPYADTYRLRDPEAPTLAVSADGSRVVAGTADGVTVFDGRTGEPVFDRPGGVTAGFDRAGTRLFVLAPARPAEPRGRYELIACDARTGREVGRREIGTVVPSVQQFGRSGRFLAWATRDGEVTLFSADRAAEERRVRTGLPLDQVSALAVGPDDRLLAVGSPDGTVRVWDTETDRPRQVFRGHADRVTAVAFDPAGTRLVSVGWDRVAKVWDLTRHPEFTNVGTHTRGVRARRAEDFAFTPDGRELLLLRVSRGRLERWDTARAKEWPDPPILDVALEDLDMPFPGRSAAFSADGRRVATISGADPIQVKVYDVGGWLHTGEMGPPVVLDGCRSPIWVVTASRDGGRVAATGWMRAEPAAPADVVAWDADSGAVRLRHDLGDQACPALALSADGRWLAAAVRANVPIEETRPCRIRVWDLETGREAADLDAGADVGALAFDADGRQLAAATTEPAVLIWETAGWARRHGIPCLEKYGHLAFAPDGRRLAGATRELITLWDPAAGDEVLTLRGLPRPGRDVLFNPRVVFDATGTKVAAAQSDFTVYVWTAPGYRGR